MIRLKNIITEWTSLSDDDLLDIIMDYTDDPDIAAELAELYLIHGHFGNKYREIEVNVRRDPRFRAADETASSGARLAADMIERARKAMRSMSDAEVDEFRAHVAQAFGMKM